MEKYLGEKYISHRNNQNHTQKGRIWEGKKTIKRDSKDVSLFDSLNADNAMQPSRSTRKKALTDDGRFQWGNLSSDKMLDLYYYVFRFEYV